MRYFYQRQVERSLLYVSIGVLGVLSVGCQPAKERSSVAQIENGAADPSKTYWLFIDPFDGRPNEFVSRYHCDVYPRCDMNANVKAGPSILLKDYKTRLLAGFAAERPSGTPPSLRNPRLAKALEDAISIITDQLSGGGLSDSEKSDLIYKRNSLRVDFAREQADIVLTSQEKILYDEMLSKLSFNSGFVKYNEGSREFREAGFPFAPTSVGPNGAEFVVIPPGTFQLDEHQVTFTRSFEMQTTEVTQLQWVSIMGENHSKFVGANKPVENISWSDTQKFVSKLNELYDGYEYRLPTDAEWEYAARAGTTTRFHQGNDITTDQENFNGNLADNGYGDPIRTGHYRGTTIDVGSLPNANSWGLFDMHGNVEEWVADRDSGHDTTLPETDPLPVDANGYADTRLLRGGSWGSSKDDSTSTYRQSVGTPSSGRHNVPGPQRWDGTPYFGIRLVRTRDFRPNHR